MRLMAANNNNLELARQLFDWVEHGNMDSVFAALAADIRAHPAIEGSSELEVRPFDFGQRGDCVIVRGYVRHREGRTLAENQAFWLFGFRDGAIQRFESHPTRESALAAC